MVSSVRGAFALQIFRRIQRRIEARRNRGQGICHIALLAEIGKDFAREPSSEPPGLPADYRVGNT